MIITFLVKNGVICKEVPQGKMVNSICRSWKGTEEGFESEAAISREKQLVPCSQCPCLFCHDSAATSGKYWLGGDEPPTLLTFSCTI
jgi:hypothetical protein